MIDFLHSNIINVLEFKILTNLKRLKFEDSLSQFAHISLCCFSHNEFLTR